mmetsp:Transcript_29657/g.64167  ORF Transcript_29657/g.64167 Transcript_29657/m.64167 type:complete len:246 (+) Transcript_29657:799-1536(+)
MRGPCPIRRRCRDVLSHQGRSARVKVECVLVARALHVPQHSPGGVLACLLLGGFCTSCKLVGDPEQHDVDDGDTFAVVPLMRPRRREPLACRVAATEIVQNLSVVSALHTRGGLWRGHLLFQQQLLAPFAHEESQSALGSITLSKFLGRMPLSCHVMGNAVEEEGHCGSKGQGSIVDHAVVKTPLQDRPMLRSMKLAGALYEFLQQGNHSLAKARRIHVRCSVNCGRSSHGRRRGGILLLVMPCL